MIKSAFGKVDPKLILNTHLFNYDRAQQAAGWIKELNNQHTPETEEYGISSFVFRTHRPFHPDRFWHFAQSRWPSNVVRSKGIFWMLSRPDEVLLWSQAGGSLKAEVYGKWWASVPEAKRMKNPAFLENFDFLQKKWNATWGDRLNELVIIGQQMDRAKVESELHACLCTDQEIEAFEKGAKLVDTWPF
jgi:G3E family GTPase